MLITAGKDVTISKCKIECSLYTPLNTACNITCQDLVIAQSELLGRLVVRVDTLELSHNVLASQNNPVLDCTDSMTRWNYMELPLRSKVLVTAGSFAKMKELNIVASLG
jgi:hypothetical protein